MGKIFRKKEIGCIFFLLFSHFQLTAQSVLQYLPCLTCPSGVAAQNFAVNSTTDDVVSDFGRRDAFGVSAWHRGIDLTVKGVEDYGYHLLSPVSGTITKLFIGQTGYKYIVVDGPGNQDFGFGHIFNDQSLPIVVGDLVLKQCDNLNAYAIINLTTHKAIGPVSGSVVTYASVSYTVSNQVQAGQVIAPLGTSGSVLSHVHVYHPLNPLSDPQSVTNAKDPLELVNHYPTDYVSSISSFHNLAQTPGNINFAGNTSGSVVLQCVMQNPGIMGNPPDQYYHTAVMDVDREELFIKREDQLTEPCALWGGPNSNYALIQGLNYTSCISNGSRTGSVAYPADVTGNDHGSTTHTGIFPCAYNNQPYDYYYFSDIYTRIHKDHIPGQALKLAAIVNEARYKDGNYSLHPRITRVNGIQNAVNASVNNRIRIDNFRPYIVKVMAQKNSVINPFYNAEWVWDGGVLSFNLLQNSGVVAGNDVIVRIFTSEPMDDLSLSVGTWTTTSNLPVFNSNRMEWVLAVPSSALQVGTNYLRISGHDLADNLIEGFINKQPKPGTSFPVRISESQWSPGPTQQEDVVHQIKVLDNSPLVADFFPSITTINPGDYVSFVDQSTGGNILTWNWEFDGGNPPVSTTQNPVIQYNSLGEYNVKLTINNTQMNAVKEGKVIVVGDLFPPQADFTPRNITLSQYTTVHFLDLSTGNPDQWFWDFDGATQPSSLQNPEVYFTQTGTFYISLTVMNDAGYDHAIGSITVIDEPMTMDALCLVNPFLASPGTLINLQGSVFNATAPYLYTFDFGDGTIIPISSSSLTENVSHVYYASGHYNLTVSITDAQDHMNSCYESIEILGGNPCEDLAAEFTMSPGGVNFSAPENTNVVFTENGSGGTPPYLCHWTFYNDPVTGAQPSVSQLLGPGPHNVLFYQAGNYPVALHISDVNGCGNTINRNITVFKPQHCLVAKINKQIGGALTVPLGINDFWDFTFVPWCGLCQDPPGTSNFPCETNNHWRLYRHPLNMLLASKYGLPYHPEGCVLNSSLEQLFRYNFTQKGYYKLYLDVWDEDCNVVQGFDCQDQTSLMIRVIDCNESISICNGSIAIQPGLNPDIYSGNIRLAGPACPMTIPANTMINCFATMEVRMLEGFVTEQGCEFIAAIKPCPSTTEDPPKVMPADDDQQTENADWDVNPNPVSEWLSVRFTQDQQGAYRLIVFNLLGEAVINKVINGQKSAALDFEPLVPGIYLLLYKGVFGEWTRKVIKK